MNMEMTIKHISKILLTGLCAPLVHRFWVETVAGMENIPCRGACILVANHNSYMDFIVLGAVCELLGKRNVHFWANQRITRLHPLFRHLATVCEAIPVDRKAYSGAAWRRSLELLEQDKHLAIFPEGTRSRSGKLQPFRTGYLKLAMKAEVPVVPVTIRGAFDIWPPHRKFPRINRKCSLVFHPPIDVPGRLSAEGILILNQEIQEKYYGCN